MQLYLLVNEKCNLKCGFCIRGKGIQDTEMKKMQIRNMQNHLHTDILRNKNCFKSRISSDWRNEK